MAYINSTAKGFCEEYGEKLLNDLFEALYEYMEQDRSSRNGKSTPKKSLFPNIHFHSFVRHNALNVEAWGYFDDPKNPDSEEQIEFRIQDGDWNGSELVDYGSDLAKPERTIYMSVVKMVPEGHFKTKEEYAKYVIRFEESKEQLKELSSSYDYDRHFAPGLKTNSYYREKAEKFPFVWDFVSKTIPVE